VSDRVRYEFSGRVCTITMDDGKANALSPAMLGDLAGAFDRAENDRAVVVLTGRPGRFSGGFDLAVFRQGTDEVRAMLLAGARLAERMLTFPTPVVVGCNGHALAMAAFLLLSADVRVGAEGAFKIGLNEVAIGLTVPHYGIEIARQRLAPAHFSLALMTGRIYEPAEAVVAGFLDRIVPAEGVVAAAHDAAAALATIDMAAHHATKQRARAATLAALRTAMAQDFGSI
jgi:enoyl-CoA hydratase